MSAGKDKQIRVISESNQLFFLSLSYFAIIFSVLLVLSLLSLAVSFFTIPTLIVHSGSYSDYAAFGFKPTPPPNESSVIITPPPDQTASTYHFITTWG